MNAASVSALPIARYCSLHWQVALLAVIDIRTQLLLLLLRRRHRRRCRRRRRPS